MGISAAIFIAVNGAYRSQYKRHAYFVQLPFRVVIIESQENNPFQPLFLNQLQRYRYLVFLIIHLL